MHKFVIALALAFSSSVSWAKIDVEACERNLLAQLQTADFVSTLAPLAPAGDIRGAVSELLQRRTPEQQIKIDERLTRLHGEREMSFQVKNADTGNYDKFVDVHVNGSVAPIDKDDYDRLVRSTEPVMQALRRLLQRIYSQSELTIDSLGLSHLPPDEAELALKVIRSSIYFEPALRDPAMADYPFLAVGGFDGAIVDPKSPQAQFFEFNLGTPSGLSNNIQMMQDLRKVDPELWGLLLPHLMYDSTFRTLAETIFANARAWTQREGISVVISPGIYNGAHPDVATIARATGMPLVRSSDLYEDIEGNIRLRTQVSARDPIVTGVYGRMEESFFLQSNRDGIPMISPAFKDNAELGHRLGVDLRPGAIYKFKYDEHGQINDVERDENGKPVLEEVWDSLGCDPSRPDAEPGSLLKAVRSRHLYYSALGGRVVDDKRLFRIVSSYLVDRPNAANLARPTRSLSPADYELFFANPNGFVVKEPGNSGGVGIYFPTAMPADEVQALVEKVRATPSDYEIQYISTIATLPQAVRQDDGTVIRQNVPIDLRMFVMMGPDGKVTAGPNSILLRTGAAGGLYTNTSRGGGYGIGVVVGARARSQLIYPNEDWRAVRNPIVPASRDFQIDNALGQIRDLVSVLGGFEVGTEEQKAEIRLQALSASFAVREIMDLLSPENLKIAALLRGFAQGEGVTPAQIEGQIIETFKMMRSSRNYAISDGVYRFNRHHGEWLWALMEDPVRRHANETPRAVEMRKLPQPEVSYWFNEVESKVELAEYIRVDDPVVQGLIDEVRANGGQVRFLQRRYQRHDSTPNYSWNPPYFWVNLNPESPSYLIPVVGIDLSRSASLPALAHEVEHFRTWSEIYKRLCNEGYDRAEASRLADLEIWTDDMQVISERRSVMAEMQAELDHPENAFSQGRYRARQFFELSYVNRLMYPEFESVRQALRRKKWNDGEYNEERVHRYAGDMVRFALENKTKAIEYWRAQAEKFTEEKKFWEADKARVEHSKFVSSSIFELLSEPYGMERLHEDGTREEFRTLLLSLCAEMSVSEKNCVGTSSWHALLPLQKKKKSKKLSIE